MHYSREFDDLGSRRRRQIAGNAVAAALLLSVVFSGAEALAQGPEDMQEVRERALELVNESRAANGLPALEAGPSLDAAAVAHADDMLARDYYSHQSPEGDAVTDRYVEAGGSRWELVAENIAQCTGCSPDLQLVEELQQGWMDSPGHRANILAEGLQRFGFGLAGADGAVYAVQTFAGSGTPRGLDGDEETRVIDADEQEALLLETVNAARDEANLPLLEVGDSLSAAAGSLVPDPSGPFEAAAVSDLGAAIPSDARARWGRLVAVSGACGGCGADTTEADVTYFAEDWLQSSSYRSSFLSPTFTHLGFALAANGEGKKIALAVLGQAR